MEFFCFYCAPTTLPHERCRCRCRRSYHAAGSLQAAPPFGCGHHFIASRIRSRSSKGFFPSTSSDTLFKTKKTDRWTDPKRIGENSKGTSHALAGHDPCIPPEGSGATQSTRSGALTFLEREARVHSIHVLSCSSDE